jgi:ADP-heptose:LPS heptosyltransferase
MTENILVIRLGALGDLVMAFQSFYEIRCAHPAARIALLTAPAFADFALKLPWFDEVLIDHRPPFSQPIGWWRLRRDIATFAPTRIYDLQGKRRQTVLYALLGGPLGPQWSGAAPFCHLPRVWPPRPDMHFMDFLAAQLRLAGVPPQPPVDLAWFDAPLDNLSMPGRAVIFMAGCTPKLAHKRWPAQSYGQLAMRLRAQGYGVILAGTQQDADAISVIRAAVPDALDYSCRTSLPQLAALARRSMAVVGNDTGPLHLAAAVGAPTLALLSSHTNPVWSRPPGPRVTWLKRDALTDLTVDEVFLALQPLLAHNAPKP